MRARKLSILRKIFFTMDRRPQHLSHLLPDNFVGEGPTARCAWRRHVDLPAVIAAGAVSRRSPTSRLGPTALSWSRRRPEIMALRRWRQSHWCLSGRLMIASAIAPVSITPSRLCEQGTSRPASSDRETGLGVNTNGR
jgi:hypothetical protein